MYVVNTKYKQSTLRGTKMDLIDVQIALKDRRLFMVAAATKLHVNTIRNIRDGIETNPKASTMKLLVDYLSGGKTDEA